jgi:hypothetical protein
MPVNNKFTVEEFKSAKKIATAMSQPGTMERLAIQASAEFAYIPELQEAMKNKFVSYVKNVNKIINEAPTIKPDMFSEEIMPPDSEIQKVGEKLAVLEYGAGTILRGLYTGTLTQNEIDAFREYHPEAATKLSEEFMKRLSDPNFNKNIPQREKELMGAIIGVEVVNPVVSGVMLANYSKEDEEEKPGPKPQAQWVEGRFPGTQLAGSYAVEQRRNT